MIFFVELLLSDEEKKKFALQEIEKHLRRNGTSLANFTSMPQLPPTDDTDSNVLILDERSYDRQALVETLDRDVQKMTDEQRKIFDEILDAVNEERGGMFFVYGFGGTGKTFMQLFVLKEILFLMLHQVESPLCC